MKKVMIVLLSALLLLSFTSCEKDKSGEIVSTFEKFVNNALICYDATYLGENGNKTEAVNYVDKGDAKDLLADLDSKYKDLDETTITLTNPAGKITKESDVTTYSGISVDYSFPFNGETVTGTLTVDGTYKYVTEGDTETSVYDMTVNGTKYHVEWTRNTKTGKFVSASVGEKSVEVRLLNSDVSLNA
jgi:hypothetical protein